MVILYQWRYVFKIYAKWIANLYKQIWFLWLQDVKECFSNGSFHEAEISEDIFEIEFRQNKYNREQSFLIIYYIQ
jgi:hypothetical protein